MCAVKLECVSGIGKTPARYASSTSPALKSSDNATRSWSGQSSSGSKACDRLTIPSCHQRRQRPVTTGPRTPTAAPRGGTPPWREQKGSEVELIDVVLVELVGIAEEHRVVGADGELAELAGGEGVALLAGDLTLDEGCGRVRGEVAEILGAPQRELGDGAVLDVLTHLVRGAQTGQEDLALGARRRQVASRSGDTDGRRGDDALEVRVSRQQTSCLVEGGLVVIVAVNDVYELDVRVAGGQLGLHEVNPGVLVRRVGRSGQDCDLARVADLLGDHVDLNLGDAVGGGLVDEQVAALRVGVGVDLGIRRSLGGADFGVRAAQLANSGLATLVRGVEVRIAEVLGEEGGRSPSPTG